MFPKKNESEKKVLIFGSAFPSIQIEDKISSSVLKSKNDNTQTSTLVSGSIYSNTNLKTTTDVNNGPSKNKSTKPNHKRGNITKPSANSAPAPNNWISPAVHGKEKRKKKKH